MPYVLVRDRVVLCRALITELTPGIEEQSSFPVNSLWVIIFRVLVEKPQPAIIQISEYRGIFDPKDNLENEQLTVQS
jgi:hypothetical protein